jgi:hypothetical protein
MPNYSSSPWKSVTLAADASSTGVIPLNKSTVRQIRCSNRSEGTIYIGFVKSATEPAPGANITARCVIPLPAGGFFSEDLIEDFHDQNGWLCVSTAAATLTGTGSDVDLTALCEF